MNPEWVELKIKEQENRMTAMRADINALRCNLEMLEEKVEILQRVKR